MNGKQRLMEEKPARSVRAALPAIQLLSAEALQHHQAGRLNEAEQLYRQVLAADSHHADSLHLLGLVAQQTGRHDLAIDLMRKATGINSKVASYHSNLGAALAEQGRLDEAIACFCSALNLEPDYAEAHSNLASALLLRGDMATGWEEYEWRWKTKQLIVDRRDLSQPHWRGETAPGQTLLIHAEQGFGDTLQFCRYASLAAARGLRVIMEVQKPLVRLLRGLPGADLVVAPGEKLPPFDLHCPMLSLPLAVGTTLTTVPSAVSYLRADEAQVAAWQTRLAARANRDLRIGLVWAGNPRLHLPAAAAVDRRRSLAPDRLGSLFDVPGVHFFSLQKGGPAAPSDLPLTDS